MTKNELRQEMELKSVQEFDGCLVAEPDAKAFASMMADMNVMYRRVLLDEWEARFKRKPDDKIKAMSKDELLMNLMRIPAECLK